MKNACFALIGFLATAAFADLTPNTIIDNVPGDTTISNLVAASSVKSVEIDPTLSEEGKAADAKKVKEVLNGKLDAYHGVAGSLQVGNYHNNPALVITSGDNTYGSPTIIILDNSISPNGDGAVTVINPSSRLGDGSFVGIELPNRDGTLALTSDIPTPVAVIDPASATTTGKAADALEVKYLLNEKFDKIGGTITGLIITEMGVRIIGALGDGSKERGISFNGLDGEYTYLIGPQSGGGVVRVPSASGTLALTSDIPAPYTPPPYLRSYDEVRKCWWRGRMVNGVINWEVE